MNQIPETPSPAFRRWTPLANVKRHTARTRWLLYFAFFLIGACGMLASLAYFQP